jgi:hypothetical protein
MLWFRAPASDDRPEVVGPVRFLAAKSFDRVGKRLGAPGEGGAIEVCVVAGPRSHPRIVANAVDTKEIVVR